MKFELTVSWKMIANVLVEADSYEEAEALLKRELPIDGLKGRRCCPYGPEYLSNSFEVEGDSGNDPDIHPDENFLHM